MVWAEGLIDNPGGRAIKTGDTVSFLPLGLLLQ
jgi:molybdopterin molybdotransferase